MSIAFDTLTTPRDPGMAERPPATDDVDQTSILIVDDLPEKLLVYETILEDLGVELVTVRSGEEALWRVLRQDFAVILLDVNMPGMDGFETARLIRQRKRSAHTPIIFLTAFVDEVRTLQGYATGGVDYIPTPPEPEILRAKVRVFVELFRMRKQVAQQVEEQTRRAAAEESARRSAFLVDASRELSSSLDLDTTLGTLARLPVPHLAEISLVTLIDDHTAPTRTEWAAGESRRAVEEGSVDGPVQMAAWLRTLIHRAVSEGKYELIRDMEPVPALLNAEGPAAAGASCVLVLPLLARGRSLGALTLCRGRSSRRFQPGDVSLADELAGLAGIALDNALLVRDIQERDRRKNEFLAMLAHELRNPLAPIRNAVHLMQMSGVDPADQTWAREVIDRQVAQLVRLVDDLLDVSRITRGKIRLQFAPVEAAAIVTRAVETSRPLIDSHQHELSVSVPDEPIVLQGDEVRLAQVLANLLNNAAKYTPDKGRIWVTLAAEDDEVVFRVRDTGAGIPREMLSRVFDLFTQLDGSLDRAHGGLGIGLTLVSRLVELHGGTVQVFSEGAGQGSEFIVRLPLRADPDASWCTAAPSIAATTDRS